MPDRLVAFAALAASLLTGAPGAHAGDRFATEGVTLRLLAEAPSADGRFRAALLVGLEPGWKTYWLDPGEAGIPPAFRFGGASQVTAAFPAPHRFDDGFATSIVYSEPFAVALEGTAEPGATPAVEATLGICRDVCIPVSAELDAGYAATGEVRGAVEAAFAALPRESSGDAGLVGASLSADGRTLTVAVRPASAAAKADLFVAGPRGWAFGAPDAVTAANGAASVALPVTARPRKEPDAPFAVDAILAGPAGAWRATRLPVARKP